MTLRIRLTAFIAVVVAAAVALVGWLAYTSTASEAVAEIDRFLENRAEAGGRFPGPGPGPGELGDLLLPLDEQGPLREFARFDSVAQLVEPDGTVVRVIGRVTLPVDGPTLESARAGGSTLQDVVVDGIHYRMIAAPGPDGTTLLIARDLTETDRVLSGLRVRLVLAGSAGVVLAAIGAWFLSRRALRPVGELTDTAEDVAATGNLEARIPVTRDDEVGRLATAFNSMLSALAASRRQQRRLVDDAGHELRTPLTSLRTNLEVLARNRDMDPDERAGLMADVAYEIEQLSSLVGEIVELAGDAGEAADPPEPTPLGELVAEAVDRARRRSGRTVDVSGSAGIARVRPDRILRALANLLDNADKWSPPGGVLEIALDGGRVEVRDRGPGFTDEDLDRVFDRFYRSEASRSMPGSGLGLAIVEEVAREHGGRAWASNRAGGGAAVGFEVPLEEVVK